MKKIIFIIIGILTFSRLFAQDINLSSLTPMPTSRYGMCSVVYDDKIWIMGGKDENDNTLNTVECFYPVENRWDADVPNLQTNRFNAAAVVYEDRIYIIGGRDENGALQGA